MSDKSQLKWIKNQLDSLSKKITLRLEKLDAPKVKKEEITNELPPQQ